jgi:hypothetical protein
MSSSHCCCYHFMDLLSTWDGILSSTLQTLGCVCVYVCVYAYMYRIASLSSKQEIS